MTKNPSRKRSKAFVLIIPLVTSLLSEVVIICRSRTLRGMRIIFSQVIQLHFGEWEVAMIYGRLGGVETFKFVLIIPQAILNSPAQALRLMGCSIAASGGPRGGVKMLKDDVFLANNREYYVLPKGKIIYGSYITSRIFIYLYTIEATSIQKVTPGLN